MVCSGRTGHLSLRVSNSNHAESPTRLNLVENCANLITIIIIINEEIVVAFSPRSTKTRYKVKNETAKCVGV